MTPAGLWDPYPGYSQPKAESGRWLEEGGGGVGAAETGEEKEEEGP